MGMFTGTHHDRIEFFFFVEKPAKVDVFPRLWKTSAGGVEVVFIHIAKGNNVF